MAFVLNSVYRRPTEAHLHSLLTEHVSTSAAAIAGPDAASSAETASKPW